MSEGALINAVPTPERRAARRLAILSDHLQQFGDIASSDMQRFKGLVTGAVSSSYAVDHPRRDILYRNFALALLSAREEVNDAQVEAAATKLPPDFSLSDTYEVNRHMFSKSVLQQHGKNYGGVGGYKLGW